MFSYNYISNELPRELIEVYNDLQTDLLRLLARNLKQGTQPIKVYADIQSKVAEYKPQVEKVTAVIFKDSEKKTVKANQRLFNAEETEENDALTENEANATVQPLYLGALAFLRELDNKIINSSAVQYAARYQEMQYASGMNAIKRVYNNLIKNGISIYESFGGGKSKNYSVENILRRDVMSLVNKSNAEVDKENFMKSSAEFVEVSSHPTARTWNKYMKNAYEDHSAWQGKVYYSRDKGKVDGYQEFESTCGYGEMLGICGINCYHQFQMNYTGDSAAAKYDKAEVERQYALSQQQRALERAIRQLKQARAVWEEAGQTQLAKDIGSNIRTATSALKDFCEKNGLKYYSWRTQI